MLNLYGTMTGNLNSIVLPNNPPTCNCAVVLPDSIVSNFTFAIPSICDSTFLPLYRFIAGV